ncbi:hypothetical protein LTR91_023674 [Friedmanniomyces endolithicus]|uniref:Cell division cycle protein 123 n=1 Tax=Friedmanniomyces endolithicus TaxID=329885 RepID=A0AAN6JXL1_9PEZI|nr:hypothetical protein LTR91_023674 [Friedmanniomyces endolithicus]KAK1030751.1 hypothetical protein LTS16_018593 [Friedmanniomyces endolithicus]
MPCLLMSFVLLMYSQGRQVTDHAEFARTCAWDFCMCKRNESRLNRLVFPTYPHFHSSPSLSKSGRTVHVAMPEPFDPEPSPSPPTSLPFPPVTRAHILNCSYHSWHPKYKSFTPKSRVIPLTKPFLAYLRADGIVLPDDEDEDGQQQPVEWDSDSAVFSASHDDDDDSDNEEESETDPAEGWRDLHNTIKATIAELGDVVLPKLNWSAPKDATWINAGNSMECRTAGDVYLLLKSSDFVTHDLEHAFDDTVITPGAAAEEEEAIPYCLVLRKAFQLNPSLEFRCFVRNRRLLCLCQRDMNYYPFLAGLEGRIRGVIQEFFEKRVRDTFEDGDFVMDVYVPAPYGRCWVLDFNPWAGRTDPLLFSWMEILTMEEPPVEVGKGAEEIVRVSVDGGVRVPGQDGGGAVEDGDSGSESETDSEVDEELWLPELRLLRKDDPEAYSFNTPQYSAHKLPRDVVDASQSGEGLREFARDWQDILARRQKAEEDGGSSDGE